MINLSKPYFTDLEETLIREVLESGWVAGQGPKGAELSQLLCEYTGAHFAVPVNNCTAALHLALLALGVGPGDDVLVSDFTFPATGHSVMYCGAKPRFVDVLPDTYNMDPDKIQEMINPRTKAIIVVHALGQMAAMDRICDIARTNGLFVIEDAACSLGASYMGLNAGQYGDITAFSFHARKNVTSGEGGALVTNNESYAATMKSLSCFGMESAYARQNEFSVPEFRYLGYNYKLSDINAAIAIGQLKNYPKVLDYRYSLVERYNHLLSGFSLLNIPYASPEGRHVYQTYAVLLNEKINRNQVIMMLKEKGIQSQIGTYSSFIQPVYHSEDVCQNSLRLYNSCLALPLHHHLKPEDIDYIVDTLMQILKQYE